MSGISTEIAEFVAGRANQRCESGRLSQVGQEATFHIDHVQPKSAGGTAVVKNLALACVSCSLRKSARLEAVDPETGTLAPLFSPRNQTWSDHFRWDNCHVVGLTPVGRATVAALAMNRPLIVAIRREEMQRGRHPPLEITT